MTTQPELKTWRCRTCGRIIMRAELPPGAVVEVKCKGCNTFNTVEVTRTQTVLDTRARIAV